MLLITGKHQVPNPIGPYANTSDTRAMRVPRSCTYVPLKQRYDGYAKYAERIGYGLRAFAGLRRSIERNEWEAAAAAVDEDAGPTPARDILLKAATAPSTLPTHNRTMCIDLDLRVSESIAEQANPCLLRKQAALLNSQLLVSPNNLREARRIHTQCVHSARNSHLRGSRVSPTSPQCSSLCPCDHGVHPCPSALDLGTNQVRELSLANFYVNEVGPCHRQRTTASTPQR